MTKRSIDSNNLDKIDVGELLRQRRQIAHIWSTEDIREVRPDLNDDEAWVVLQECDRRLDSDTGLSWELIGDTAHDLFPPTERGNDQ